MHGCWDSVGQGQPHCCPVGIFVCASADAADNRSAVDSQDTGEGVNMVSRWAVLVGCDHWNSST